MKNDVICVIQARMNSSRFPAKVAAPISNYPILYYVIKRVEQSKIKKIIVATTKMPVDDVIDFLSCKYNIDCLRGDESDVLSRYVKAARSYKAKAIIRITADCPLVDPKIIDKVVNYYKEKPGSDYVFIKGYPLGLGAAELISAPALETIYRETKPSQHYYREHVVTYILDHKQKFNLYIKKAPIGVQKKYRLCIDELKDLEVIRKVYEHFLPRLDFSTEEIIKFLDRHREIAKINQSVK